MQSKQFLTVVLQLVAVFLALSVQYLALALVLPAFTVTFLFTAVWFVASPLATLYLVLYSEIRVLTVWEFTVVVYVVTDVFHAGVTQGVFRGLDGIVVFAIRMAAFAAILAVAYHLTRQHVLRDLIRSIRARAQS